MCNFHADHRTRHVDEILEHVDCEELSKVFQHKSQESWRWSFRLDGTRIQLPTEFCRPEDASGEMNPHSIMHLLLKMDVTNRYGMPLALTCLVGSNRLSLPSAKSSTDFCLGLPSNLGNPQHLLSFAANSQRPRVKPHAPKRS